MILKGEDAHLRQTVDALDEHGEGLEELQIFEHHVVTVGNYLAPVCAARGGDRGSDDAEGSGGVVYANVPKPVAVVGVVLDVFAPRFDQGPLSFSIIGGQELLFAGGVAGAFEHDVLAVARAAGADIEALVGFFVNQDIFGLRPSHDVAEELVLPFGFLILNGVEEGAVIGGPDDRADALGLVGEHLACFQIFDVEGVLPESRGVGGVGQQVAVVGDADGAQGQETLADRHLVHIKHDLFGSIEGTALAAVDRDTARPARCASSRNNPCTGRAPRHRSL